MDRRQAVQAITEIINSGIIDSELEERLQEVCNRICDDEWEDCEPSAVYFHCDGCEWLKEYEDEEDEKETEFAVEEK